MDMNNREESCKKTEKQDRDDWNGKGENKEEIYFAGGCFWGVEEYFSRIPGVVDVVAGYSNGRTETPSYKQVCAGNTGHVEAVRVCYDQNQVELEVLVRQFFRIIDPTIKNRQGNDVGSQYRTGIYFTNPRQQVGIAAVMAEEAKKYSSPVVTELLPLNSFYPAEEYHQDYLRKNPFGYCHIDFSGLAELEADRGICTKPQKPDTAVLRST